MAQFLMVRRDDLVHIGVQFSGFRLDQVAASGGSRPRLVATSDQARITLTFPPQSLSERTVDPTDLFFRVFAIRANTSQVQFAVRAGTTLALNAQGILEALRSPAANVVSRGVGAGDEPTAIEIPWRLLVTPVTRVSGGSVVSDHAAQPVTSRSVAGLWHARLMASGSDASDAELALVLLRALDGDMIPPGPLAIEQRKLIVQQSQLGQGVANVRRLELSSIGGSLSVTAKWPSLEWSQDVIIGRDHKIRTVVAGLLYPFGHRALLTTVTERTFVLPQPHPHASAGAGAPGESAGSEAAGPHHPPHNGNGNGNGNGHPPPPPPPPRPKIAVAGLISNATLAVVEPVRGAAADAKLARQFPFDKVEILARAFSDIAPSSRGFFVISKTDGKPLLVPVRCTGTNGDVVLHIPMLFLLEGFAGQVDALRDVWNSIAPVTALDAAEASGGVAIDLPGLPINMFPGPAHTNNDPRDIHEVHQLVIAAAPEAGSFRPFLLRFTAELPALRTILQTPSVRVPMRYSQGFVGSGEGVDLALKPLNGFGIDFTGSPQRSGGLMAPKFTADAISRTLGPIASDALPGSSKPLDQVFPDATLLGLPLAKILNSATRQPATILPMPGNPPGASMQWTLDLQNFGPFVTEGASKATLTVNVASTPARSKTTCRVENFKLVLPPTGAMLVTLHFKAVVFTQVPGQPPDLSFEGMSFEFGDALKLLNDLIVQLQQAIGGRGPTIKALPSGVSAGFSIGLPSITAGEFLLRNVAANFAVDVPFTADPLTVSLGFASRANPFNLSILALGGGGYVDLQLGKNGTKLSRFEASMEFGATVAIDFVIASAEVHALGGVRFVTQDTAGGETITLDAFIRIGGSVEVFGLISVSIELLVLLSYHSDHNRLVGHATLVIDVDLTLFSESVTLDSGDWVLAGSSTRQLRNAAALAGISDNSLTGLVEYFGAFAP